MKFSADYRALALDALRGRWKTAVLAGLVASVLGANIVSSSDRVISNMSQNANGDTPGFAGLLSTGSGGVLVAAAVHPRRGKSLQLCHDPLYHGRAPRPDGQRSHH